MWLACLFQGVKFWPVWDPVQMTLSLAKASTILCLIQWFSCFEVLHCGSHAVIGWIHHPLLLLTPPIPRSRAWRPMGLTTPDLQSSYLCHIFEPGFWNSVLEYIYYFAKLPLFELKCARFCLESLGYGWKTWRTFRYYPLSTSWLLCPRVSLINRLISLHVSCLVIWLHIAWSCLTWVHIVICR